MRKIPVNRILLYICLFSVSVNIYLLVLIGQPVGSSKKALAPLTGHSSLVTDHRPSLRELANRKKILIGTALKYKPFVSDRQYRQTLYREFNMVTIEDLMKFNNIHPQRHQYDFSGPDLLVDFAIDNHMKVRGHTLVWGKLIPEWVQKGRYSKNEVKQILKEHIQTVVSHYKGRVFAWDVVNEAFNDDGSYRDNFWLRTLGPEYIELAFRWAHQADPNALLFYNDVNNEGLNAKSETIYQMVLDFKRRGVPIHGIGFQMHTAIDENLNQEAIAKNMKRLSDLNIEVHITEFDVKLKNDNPALKDNLNKQADIYGATLKTCLSVKNCKAFVMWGVADQHSWQKEYYPLIFDINYNPKPAYHTLIRILSQNNAASLGGTSSVRSFPPSKRRLFTSAPIAV